MKTLPITYEQETLKQICKSHHVARFSLFGSVLRDDFQPERSDLDCLVEFLPSTRSGLFNLVSLRDELELLFCREIDLVSLGGLRGSIRQRVLDSAEVLYDAA